MKTNSANVGQSAMNKPTLCRARDQAAADRIDALKAGARTLEAAAFGAAVDLSSWLDEGETLEDALMNDPGMVFWTSDASGTRCYGISSMGTELVFAPDGEIPEVAAPLRRQEIGLSALAWVLDPAGSPIVVERAGQEELVRETAISRHYVNAHGDRRYQLLQGDEVVGGLFIINAQIEAIYTRHAWRREGVGRALLALARQDYPAMRHSDSLTEDGKKFRSRTDESYAPGM